MSRKDYRLLASVLHDYGNLDNCFQSHEAILRELVYKLSRELKADNERFSEEKFLKAVFE